MAEKTVGIDMKKSRNCNLCSRPGLVIRNQLNYAGVERTQVAYRETRH